MSHFTYELDEYQPWPGMACYVYGNATICYTWEGRDRDTGEPAGPGEIWVEDINIEGHIDRVDWQPLDSAHPLYKALEKALLTDDHVVAKCIADYELAVIGYDED